MGNRKFLIGIGIAMASAPLFAKTIYFGGTIETIPVAYGSQTILRFEEPIKTISNAGGFLIKPANDEKPDYSVLSVEPRILTGKIETAFILASGEIARLKLSVIPQNAKIKVEPIYDIKSQKALIESRADVTPYVGRFDLMTAMIRGDQVSGYEIATQNIGISNKTDPVQVVLTKVYSGEEFKGYIYELHNRSNQTFELDIRKLKFGSPNQAQLAFSDLTTLEPHNVKNSATRLIVITKPTASYHDVVLPIRMTVIKPENMAGGSGE